MRFLAAGGGGRGGARRGGGGRGRGPEDREGAWAGPGLGGGLPAPSAVASARTKRGRPLPIPAPPSGPHSCFQKALGTHPKGSLRSPPHRPAPSQPLPGFVRAGAKTTQITGGTQLETRSPEAPRRALGVMPIPQRRPVQGSALLSPGPAGAMEPQSVGQGEKTDPAWTVPEGASKAPGQAGRVRTRSPNSPLPSGREARMTPG